MELPGAKALGFSTQALTETFAWRDVPAAQFAVLALDASHSLSPVMHEAAFVSVGLPYRYIAVNVPVDEVCSALDHLAAKGFLGVNVTMPHKEEALAWLSRFENPDYPQVLATNTIRLGDRLGFNTDTLGLLRSFSRLGLAPGEQCLVLGAGGSAAAAVAVLKHMGLEVAIWNRTRSRAELLAGQMGAQATDCLTLEGFRLVVHATSAGKEGKEPPVEWETAPRDCIAYDLFYAPGSTPFLRSALSRRLAVKDGVELLVYQGAEAWNCWGLKPDAPVELMEKTVRENLAAHRG